MKKEHGEEFVKINERKVHQRRRRKQSFLHVVYVDNYMAAGDPGKVKNLLFEYVTQDKSMTRDRFFDRI
jgi:hypothetical protein